MLYFPVTGYGILGESDSFFFFVGESILKIGGKRGWGCCVCLVCVHSAAVFSIHCRSERFCSISFSLVYFAPLSYSTLS